MQYESEYLKVIHQDAVKMFRSGIITEARMREYDEMCLLNPFKPSSVYANDNPVNTNQVSHATA
jgi:DNA-binding transcriptional regulator YiaG